jgi:hypothetical protein
LTDSRFTRKDVAYSPSKNHPNVSMINHLPLALLFSPAMQAHANGVSDAQGSLTIGLSFECEPYIKPSFVVSTRDDTPVNCVVLKDVRSGMSGVAVIP